MDNKNNYSPKNDPAAQDALRDEANKPQPLYDKTDRNFQRENQGPQQGTTHDKTGEEEHEKTSSSTSGEEKDII